MIQPVSEASLMYALIATIILIVKDSFLSPMKVISRVDFGSVAKRIRQLMFNRPALIWQFLQL
jgi:hypothetical protein